MGRRGAWRGLGLFWATLIVLAGAGAATLQWLGPPASPPPVARSPAPPPPPGPAEPAPPADPMRVAQPDPALLERASAFPGVMLPRIAPDGRAPRTVYAAPVPRGQPGAPRIALVLGAFGLSEAESRAALDALPGPVSFAVSSNAGAPAALYDAARAAGHELLASVPMEPQGYPSSDAGPRSLLTGLTLQDNRQNLEWALGRTPGAVGATGASDGMRGERFADMAGALDPVLDEIGRRGLLYLDPRPGRTLQRPGLATRAVDVVLDEPPARAEVAGKLATLERIAREKGSAIGLAGQPRPLTVAALAEWAKALEARGLVLVPVSALMEAPK